MSCNVSTYQIDPERKKKFFGMVVSDLLEMVKQGKSFDIKSYMRSVYDDILTQTGRVDIATAFAGIVPSHVKAAYGLNDTAIEDLLIDNLKSVQEVSKRLTSSDELFNYLDLKPIEDDGSFDDELEKDKQKERLRLEMSDIKATPFFSARPNSLLTTIGSEEEAIETDPKREHSYNFLDYLISVNKTSSIRSNFYITLHHGRNVYLDNATDNPRYKGGYLQVITNKDGEIIYFDDQYNQVEKAAGKPVFFRFRTKLSTVQSAAEIQSTRNLTPEQYDKVMANELELIAIKEEYMRKNPNGFIVQEIVGLSTGYLPKGSEKFDVAIAEVEDLSSGLIGVDTKDKKQVNYIQRSEFSEPVPFKVKKVQDISGLAEDAARIILGDFENSNTPENIAYRKKIIDVYFGNNPTVRIVAEKKKSDKQVVQVKVDNKILYRFGPELSEAEMQEAINTITDHLKFVTLKDQKLPNSLNIYKGLEEKVPFYKKEGDKIIPTEITLKEYKKFLLNNAFTDRKVTDGKFVDLNGYIQFAETIESFNKITLEQQELRVTSTGQEITTNVSIVAGTKSAKKAARENKGIYSMRPNAGDNLPVVDYEKDEYFGNPWSVKGYQNTIIAEGTTEEEKLEQAVNNYKEWLEGTRFQEIDSKRRQWILDQIDSGALDNATFIYFKSGYYSHADALVDFIKARRAVEVATTQTVVPTAPAPTVETKNKRRSFKSTSVDPDEVKNKFNKLEAQGKVFNVTPEQIETARLWYESHPMSAYVPFEVMFDAINTANPKSIATFSQSGIILYKGSNYTDLYHEAWHGFTQIFLSEAQRNKLYLDLSKRSGSFVSYDGQTVKFNDPEYQRLKKIKQDKLTEEQALYIANKEKQYEEFLAEDFREFMLNDGKFKKEDSPEKRSIFQLLLDILKLMFNVAEEDMINNNQASKTLHEMYVNLAIGNIGSPKFSVENAGLGTFDKIAPINEVDQALGDAISYKDARMLVDSIDSIMSAFIDKLNSDPKGKNYTNLVLGDVNSRAQIYTQVYSELDKKYNELLSEIENYKEGTTEYADTNRKLDLLEFVLANFSDNSKRNDGIVTSDDIIAAIESGKGVIAYHTLKSKYLTFEEKFIEDPETKSKNDKDGFSHKAGNEVSMKDLAQKELLYVLRSLFNYEADKSNKKTVLKTNELGFAELVNFETIWNKLQRNLEGIYDVSQQKMKLEELAKDDYSIAQLLGKLGNLVPADGDILQLNLWTYFNQTFGVKRIPLVQVTVNINTEDGGISVTTGKAKRESSSVARAWESNFSSPIISKIEGSVIKRARNESSETRFYGNQLDTPAALKKFEKTYKSNPIQFLNALGMDIPADIPQIVNALKKGDLKNFTEYIYTRLDFFNKQGIPLTSIKDIISKPVYLKKDDGSVEESNEEGSYKTLLDLVYQYSDEYGGAMVTNAAGDQQWEYSLRSTISQRIDSINAAESYQQMIADERMADFNVMKNPHMRGLITLKTLFGDDYGNKQKELGLGGRKKTAQIKLENSAGVTTTVDDLFAGIGVSSANNDEIGSTLQNLYMSILYNTSSTTQHADKSTALLYKLVGTSSRQNYINIGDFAVNLGQSDPTDPAKNYLDSSVGMTTAVNQFMQYLDSEIARIYRLQNGDASGNVLVGDTTYKEVGSDFITFQDILSPPVKSKLLKSFISDDFLTQINESKNTKLRETIGREIQRYLKEQLVNFQEDLRQVNFVSNDKLMSPLRNKMRTAMHPDIYNSLLNEDSTQRLDDSILLAYVTNDWIHKYETTVMFYGDPALYNHLKEEFHKRNAGIAATGNIPRTDAIINNILSSTSMRGSYATSTWYTGGPIERLVSNTFNTAVLADSISTSVYIDQYINAAYDYQLKRQETLKGKKLTKKEKDEIRNQVESDYSEYRNMKEADGQGWISFDSYRDLLIRLGKWSNYQETIYRKILNKEDISGIDIKTFFPVKKMQYWGPLKTSDSQLPVVGFHKFSLMPLIPTLIAGTQLEALHNKMVSQNIDYATMVTGSKVNTITKNGKADEFYSDRANEELAFTKDDYTFTPNTIFLDYFKDQLEVPDKFKGSVIFSTQMRKLIEEGLMENGVPTDWEPNIKDRNERIAKWAEVVDKEAASNNYKLLINYESLVNKLTEFKKRELIKEAGIRYDDKVKAVRLTPQFLEFVKKELTSQDLAEHEIDFIQYDPGSGKLKYDLSIHPSADKIERLLTAMVYKRLVRQKVKGEALVQVSGVGFQSIRFNKATAEDINKYGTNGLSSYNQEYDSKGNVIRTNAMKIKISIQGDFKQLLKHKDVLKMIKENKGMTALQALNTLIKDKAWLDKGENRRMITIAGVRIPVQGLNSMEFAEVYEFLPEDSGNIVIVPSEIVAKSGADFDIDKLTMMFPSLSSDPSLENGVELTKHDSGLAERFNKQEAKEKMLSLKKRKIAAYEELQKEIQKQIGEKEYGAYIKEQFEAYKEKIKDFRKEVNEARYNDDLVMQTYYESQIDNLVNELRENTFVTLKKTLLDDITLEQRVIRRDMEKASSFGIENQLLGAVIDILQKPENFTALTRPNTTDVLKPIADDYSKYVSDYNPFKTLTNKNGETFKRNDKRIIAGTRIFEIGYNRYKQVSNMIGKQALGIGAVDNTYNTLFNRINVYMNPEATLGSKKNEYKVNQTIRMKHNTILDPNGNAAISLSNIYDVNNKYKISDLISQAINGWVDVAKDAWIFYIQGNKEISPTLLFLLQAGVDVEQAVAFVSQPLVREYVKNIRLAKSAFGKALGVAPANPNDYRIKARAKVIKDNGFNYEGDIESTFTQKKIILKGMSDSYLSDVSDFSANSLKKRVIDYSKGNKEITDTDRAAFIHFLEIEEMAKAVTEVKQTMNFDTSKSPSLFDARMRLKKKYALENNNRLSEGIVSDIEENSPIGSFGIQDFTIKLLTNFFELRDNAIFNNFVDEFVSNADLSDYGATFRDKEVLAEVFKNDFTSYIFQQFINAKERFNPEGTYKSMKIVKRDFETISTDIVPINFLKFGAYVKDNVLYASLDEIDQTYKSKDFEKDKYEEKTGLAPVDSIYFIDLNQYIKFVYERETLRSMIPLNEYAKSKDYARRQNDAEIKVQKDEKTKLRMAYERYLRDTALINKMNVNFMMTADNGYAKAIFNVIQDYPELEKQFEVLSSLQFSPGAVKNLKLSEFRLDSDLINIYNSELEQLSDTTVIKVKDKLENERISNLFSMFPIFAFFQSGQDRVGKFAISRIVPTELYSKVLTPSIQNAMKILSNSKEAEKYLVDYVKLFNSLYQEPINNDSVDEESGYMGETYNVYRKKMKRYFSGIDTTSGRLTDISEILSAPAYNSKMRTFHKFDTYGKMYSPEEFKKAVIAIVKRSPKAVFVVDTGLVGMGRSGDTFNSSIIMDLVTEGKIPASAVIGIPTKIASYTAVPETDFLSDANYNQNVKAINKALNKMQEAIDNQKILIFDANGVGQSLLGYRWSEEPISKNRAKSNGVAISPAPKTFVYLSEKLYELGFINTNFVKALEKVDKEDQMGRAPMLMEKQYVTDREVQEHIMQCLNMSII